MFKYGLTLELPGDKKPGYYARIVKTIGQANTLFDRDGELLIFSTPEDLETAAENIARYKAAGEKIRLLLLPPDADLSRHWTDYGFQSRMGNRYLYEDLIALFTLVSRNAHSAPDLEAARLQLEEHRIALFADPETDRPVNVVERQLKPLAEGIAKAYGCAVEWVEHTGRS